MTVAEGGEIRWDLGDGQPGFVSGGDLPPRHHWYLKAGQVATLIGDRILSYVSDHEARDILLAAARALKPGGRFRIVETDWNHPSGAYLDWAQHFNPKQKFTVSSLIDLLQSVNLAPAPVEFCDDARHQHAFPAHFDLYGQTRRSSRTDSRAADPDLKFSSLIVDGIKVSEGTGPGGYTDKIYAVGDSHVRFLAGRDEGIYDWPAGKHAIAFEGYSARFTGLHLGPGLAFNLNSANSKNASKEKIEGLLRDGDIPKGAEILFSFGEIDCRYHVCRQAEAQGRPIPEIVDQVTEQYGIFLDRIAAFGYRVGVWAPPLATWHEETLDPNNPIHGTFEQRHFAIRRFNQRMEDFCRQRNMPFLSLFDLVHDDAGRPIRDWFCDVLHLSQRARPLLYDLMPDGRLP
ncbi:hypothetical protein ABAC460_08090 [Asticcacaulis sp. AC460]|uniref:SGNH/GDSL hydrolase family protein n=1 Tax=Asticcacaulis sp. AC460 TaxID=1282360 RepID=UPI0003C3EE7A|nr:SGNH/GDSL hydrolase family protein [Asticcacaulis sp. AC460]ESQ90781.1 hypothetical protein ABAC460_08090 [Asticcacaulis sp. AC460]